MRNGNIEDLEFPHNLDRVWVAYGDAIIGHVMLPEA